jgi:hypothetical protein
MLHEFLTANRDELIARCVAKVAKRPVPPPSGRCPYETGRVRRASLPLICLYNCQMIGAANTPV